MGNNIWTTGHTWLSKMSTQSGSNLTIHRNTGTSRMPRYCCPNHDRSTSVFQSWKQAFRNTGLLGRSPNINLAWCWEQCKAQLVWPHYVFPIIRRLGFMINTTSFSSSSIVFSNQWFSNYSSTMDIGYVKLLSDCFCGNRVFKMNTEFYCHLCCSSSMIFRHNPLQCTLTLLLSFGFWQLFLLADDVFPWFVYAIITLETAAVDTPNKVAVLFMDSS